MSAEPLHSQPRCVICAEPLSTGALRCNKCESFQRVRHCNSCGLPTPTFEARCIHCRDIPDGRKCRHCSASIPEKAFRCNDCGTFQNWRRWIPASEVTLALILSIISVLSAIIPPVVNYLSNQSETYTHVVGTGKIGEEPTIRVLVTNSGKRSSYVKSGRILFDRKDDKTRIDAVDTDLNVQNRDEALIPPGEHAIIHLSADSVGRLNGKTRDQVLTQVNAGGEVAVRLVVEETGPDGDPFDSKPQNSIKAGELYDWLSRRVSSQ
ncbi:MAG TPA: hypothetical protein VMU84_00700 [Thermoanaerobaculia bacterium]|nr:hypothetical protein [Thermoanaerobaculia bacterium]